VRVFQITDGEMRGERSLVKLVPAREKSGHDGDAEATADVAHEVEDASRVAHLFFRNPRHGERHEWNEEQRQRDALKDLGPEDVPVSGVQVQVGEVEPCHGGEDEAHNEQAARIDFAGEVSGDRHPEQRPDAAWRERESGVVGGIAEERLQ